MAEQEGRQGSAAGSRNGARPRSLSTHKGVSFSTSAGNVEPATVTVAPDCNVDHFTVALLEHYKFLGQSASKVELVVNDEDGDLPAVDGKTKVNMLALNFDCFKFTLCRRSDSCVLAEVIVSEANKAGSELQVIPVVEQAIPKGFGENWRL